MALGSAEYRILGIKMQPKLIFNVIFVSIIILLSGLPKVSIKIWSMANHAGMSAGQVRNTIVS